MIDWKGTCLRHFLGLKFCLVLRFTPVSVYSVSAWNRFLESAEFDFQSLDLYFSILTAFEGFTGAKAKIGCPMIHPTYFTKLHLKQSRWQESAQFYSQGLQDRVGLWSWDPTHKAHLFRPRYRRSVQRHKQQIKISSSAILYLKFLTFLLSSRFGQKYLCRTPAAADCFEGWESVLPRKRCRELLPFYHFGTLEGLSFTSWRRTSNRVFLK